MHEYYMKKALALAKKGIGRVNPNPLVGSVIVKDNQIIGEGYHQKYGEPHAERNALKNCTKDPKGATLYVNLEPCCHFGKTPPCTEAIIQSGVEKVVIGALDPNPKVCGKGVSWLKEYGIEVITGVLEEECKRLNRVFFYYITTQKPYVVMKYAMTVDGKIATVSKESKWITGEEARSQVHSLRNQFTGIMVGRGTVMRDDPLLTCRIPDGRNPIRIVCDSHLRIPMDSNIVKTAKEVPTIVATTVKDGIKKEQLQRMGIEIMDVKEEDGKVSMVDSMKKLGGKKIDGLLLEGGGTLNYAALSSGVVQELQVFIGAKIFGGTKAITPVGGDGISSIEEAFSLKLRGTKVFGEDILLEYDVGV